MMPAIKVASLRMSCFDHGEENVLQMLYNNTPISNFTMLIPPLLGVSHKVKSFRNDKV